MTRAQARWIGGGILLPLLSCTSAHNGNPFPQPTGNGGGPGGPMGQVVVAIDMPTSGQPYGVGSLVDVSARVDIQGGTDFVDGTSVKAVVTAQGGSLVLENSSLVLSAGDVYTGRVSLGLDLATGTYTLTVTAGSSGGATGSSSVDFTVDAGPTLVVTNPQEGKSYKTSVTIEVVATDPTGLMGGAPTATVGAIPVVLSPEGGPDTYRGTIDFDTQVPPLSGDQLLTVVAVNNSGQRTQVQVIFVIDNDGPVIENTTPTPGQIVGGIVQISAKVTDNAGVLDSSVIAVIGDDTSTPLFKLELAPQGSGIYSVLFDSAKLTQCPPAPGLCIVFPTVSFRASDELGNEASVGYAFAVDNIAPVADLDPPNVRDTKIDGLYLRCSWSFDPLGVDRFVGDMPNDNTVVPQVFDLRAQIEDNGNHAEGLKLVPIAGVDDKATSVYILDDQMQPLIVDTDGNGTCDSINPLLVPTTTPPTSNNQVLKVRLQPVPPGGRADFTADPSIPANQTTPCAPGLDPQVPPPLCIFEEPTEVISYAFGTPVIWSVEPITKEWCSGGQFDTLANNIDEGWACIAVGTTDRAGNFSVSAPLRVYIQYTGVSGFATAPPASAGPPPACTGVYDKASNTVTAGACSTRRIPSGRYCYLGDC